MQIFDRVGRVPAPDTAAALATLDPHAPEDYRQLALLCAVLWSERRPRVAGLSGGQGAGKSTLGALIEQACAALGMRVCVVSLDDFYLTRAERADLARERHPLFETRGPPGTHDALRCRDAMHALLEPQRVALPRFDKGRDDRVATRDVSGPFDLVVLEGWCVGARPLPQDRLRHAANDLERRADPDGIWRRAQNEQLAGPYARLFEELDFLAYLQVPSLDAVRRWRLQQEGERPADRRLDPRQVDTFVAHYEGLTRWMLEDLPARADLVVELDEAHRIAGITLR